MSFTVKQGRFEGPYHKLLEMIEDRKLSINEISLGLIADEYIAYIKTFSKENTPIDNPSQEVDIVNSKDTKDDISQFIVVAATLTLIKVKSLLPAMEYSTEEKEEVATLEHKLNLYKVLIDGSKVVRSIWYKQQYARNRMKISDIVFSPGNLKSITLQSVSILTMVKLPHLERLRQVAVEQAIKIENVIEDILNHIKESTSDTVFKFNTIYKNLFQKYFALKNKIVDLKTKDEERTYAIVSFLAILDMIRNGLIEAQSVADISDIDIEQTINKNSIVNTVESHII